MYKKQISPPKILTNLPIHVWVPRIKLYCAKLLQ